MARLAVALKEVPVVDVPHVTVRGLRKSFGSVTIYDGFDVDIPRGRFVSIFGPNGCGKSTLMNMIAGLIPLDAGEILFDGKSLKDTDIGYVFQNYRDALFPWITAWDNIAYPLRRRGMRLPERLAGVGRAGKQAVRHAVADEQDPGGFHVLAHAAGTRQAVRQPVNLPEAQHRGVVEQEHQMQIGRACVGKECRL